MEIKSSSHGIKVFDPKKSPSLLNYRLQQYRSSPWMKLLSLWALYEEYQKEFDYFVFLDSDAVINPRFHSTSFQDLFDRWGNQKNQMISSGQQNITLSDMLVLIDSPWSTGTCTGIFFLKVSEVTQLFLEEWWNYNNPIFNTEHPFEQGIFNELLTSKKGNYINYDTVSVVAQPGFVSLRRTNPQEQFFVHLASYESFMRIPIFTQFVSNLGLSLEDDDLSKEIEEILTLTKSFSPVEIGRRMDRPIPEDSQTSNNQQMKNLTFTPEKTPGFKIPDELPPCLYYEGRLFSHEASTFIVGRGKRWKLGFPLNEYPVFISPHWVQKIAHFEVDSFTELPVAGVLDNIKLSHQLCCSNCFATISL